MYNNGMHILWLVAWYAVWYFVAGLVINLIDIHYHPQSYVSRDYWNNKLIWFWPINLVVMFLNVIEYNPFWQQFTKVLFVIWPPTWFHKIAEKVYVQSKHH